MVKQVDWEKLIRRMEFLMRLKHFPVAFKMLQKKEDLEKILFMRKPGNKATLTGESVIRLVLQALKAILWPCCRPHTKTWKG